MSETTQARNTESSAGGWILAGIALALLVFLLLVGSFSPGERNAGAQTQTSSTGMTAQTGVVKMPTATPTAAAIGARGGENGEIVLLPGRKVASISPDGRGTRVYAVPSRSGLVMDLYRDGAAFVVLDPASQSAGYPIEAEGFTWYRVRASDGLVGWVIVDRLVPLE